MHQMLVHDARIGPQILHNVVEPQTAAFLAWPLNQRNNRIPSSRPMSCRSERMVKNACSSQTLGNGSGGIEARPRLLIAVRYQSVMPDAEKDGVFSKLLNLLIIDLRQLPQFVGRG